MSWCIASVRSEATCPADTVRVPSALQQNVVGHAVCAKRTLPYRIHPCAKFPKIQHQKFAVRLVHMCVREDQFLWQPGGRNFGVKFGVRLFFECDLTHG